MLAAFLAVFVVALVVVFLTLLPEARGGASLLRRAAASGGSEPPATALIPGLADRDGSLLAQPPSDETEPVELEPEPEPPFDPDANCADGVGDIDAIEGAETRERGVFFVLVEDDGASLSLVRASRELGISDTPLIDALNALLAGPTPEEAALGVTSFMPPGARLLRAEVRGQTAYINFSEDFQFNTHGTEGLDSQIRQLVWTATEFPNVLDVQILIEGNRVDFLHGDLRIGSPIARDPGSR